jgi:TRAP-type mannitol/chloroaromatic compound transport system permease small subunit
MTNRLRTPLTQHVAAAAGRIDRFIAAVGRTVMWLVLFVVITQFAVVVMRYALAVGWIAVSEAIVYAHAAVFLLAAAWTLQQNGHARVDIFYARASTRTRTMVDLVGTVLLLLPVMGVIIYFGAPYAARSWAILERSREASGLPFVYLLKTLIPLFALLMALQGISLAVRAVLILTRQGALDAAVEIR